MTLSPVLTKIFMSLVPRIPFEKKMKQWREVEDRTTGYDMRDWEYRYHISGVTGWKHRYLYLPSLRMDAPVLFCIHGMNLDAKTYFHIDSLREKYTIIVYDFPTSSPAYVGGMDCFTNLINDFLDELEINQCYLMGVSFGGAVALKIAVEGRIEVNKLILVSSSMLGVDEEEIIQYESFARYMLNLPDYKLFFWVSMMSTTINRGRPNINGHAYFPQKHLDWYKQILRSFGTHYIFRDAERVTCPVTILQGAKDKVVPMKDAQRLFEYIPSANFITVEGAGHSMIFDNAETVTRLIGENLPD